MSRIYGGRHPRQLLFTTGKANNLVIYTFIMNTTIGLGILNNTLRIAMYCGAFNLWFEPDPSGIGVAWHGFPAWDFANMRPRIGLEYEVLTELPQPRDNLYSDMLALMDGVADVSIDGWGVNYERSKLIDFSYPTEYGGIYIMSGARKGSSHADLVMGVYDDTSFGLLILAIVAIILTSWLLLKKEGSDCSLLTCALYIFENVLHQPLNRSIVPKSFYGRAIMTFFTIYNLALNLMYMSIIISLLVSGSKPPQIDSLADLNIDEYKNVRILMRRQGYVGSYMKSAKLLRGLEHRVDFFDTADRLEPYIIKSMLNGSHVYIEDVEAVYDNICHNNKVAKKIMTKLEDFRKSRQDFSFLSIHSIILGRETFFSFRDPVFSTTGGYIFRKGFEHKAKIDNELMWLYALGLQSRV